MGERDSGWDGVLEWAGGWAMGEWVHGWLVDWVVGWSDGGCGCLGGFWLGWVGWTGIGICMSCLLH